jgi:hypothetical protein
VFKFYKAVPLSDWNPYALAVGAKREDSDGETEMFLVIHDDDSDVRLSGEQLIILRDLLLEMSDREEQQPQENEGDVRRMRRG